MSSQVKKETGSVISGAKVCCEKHDVVFCFQTL